MKMMFKSFFSGIGGFDLGFERAGMTCVMQCENDQAASGVLARHYPGVERVGDVTDVTRYEPTDLICGGFPCQDVSLAGRRAGLAGKRSGLWFEFIRVIANTLPRWVVIENVPGLLSSNKGEDFAVILRGLVECGYGVSWRILDAQYFGVAQRRRRVFIIGSLGSGRSAKVLFESEGLRGNTAKGRKPGKDVAHSLTASPTASGGLDPTGETFVTAFSADGDGADWQEDITPTLLHKGDEKSAHGAYQKMAIIGSLQAHTQKHGHATSTQQAAESGQLITIIEQNNMASTPDMISLRSNPAQPAILWDKAQVTSPQNRSIPSTASTPTLNASGQMMVGVRRLTPTECERLQGFPDGWTDGQSDSARYRQLGNAVAVPPAEWLGRRIVLADAQ